MSNADILKELMDTEAYCGGNAETLDKVLPKWDNTESVFPLIDAYKYIKFDRWDYEDFTFHRESLIRKYLPQPMYPIFLTMKKFLSYPHNSLSSIQKAFAKFRGLRYDTYAEQAFVVYMEALEKYCDFKQKEDVDDK